MAKFEAVAEQLAKDPAVWSRVQAELSAAQNRPVRLAELAREYGFTLDANEIDRAVRAAGGELNEGQLESVSGGFNPQPDPPGMDWKSSSQGILIGLLVPAVQKVRGL